MVLRTMSSTPVVSVVSNNKSIPILGNNSKSVPEKWKQDPQDDSNNYSDLSDHSENNKNSSKTKIAVDTEKAVKQNVISATQGNSDAVTERTTATEKPNEIGGDFEQKIIEDLSSSEADDFAVNDSVFERSCPQRAISNMSALSINTGSYHGGGGDGNSVCGASTDGSYCRSTRAESIRARMRQQEKRLSELVQKQATSETVVGGQFKQEMDDVKSNLDKVEQEKYALEQKLEFLKSQQTPEQAAVINKHDVTDHDAFLRDKLNGIQRGFQEQASKIQALETEIITKNSEVDKYRQEIVEKLKKIVELEFDLEMHDIHYTDYFNNQFKLGDEALDFIKKGKDGSEDDDQKFTEHSVVSDDNEEKSDNNASDSTINFEGILNGKKLTPKRAQKLIAKLLKDLDHLEATYKKEKFNSIRTKELLTNENEELRTKVHVLESEEKQREQLKSSGKNGIIGLNEGSGYINLYRLRKRVETLEAKRFLYRKEMARVQDEMKELEKQSELHSRKYENELSKIQLELEASNVRFSALLDEQNGIESPEEQRRYANVEQKILDNYENIAKMQTSSEIKDRQIDSLKKEVQQIRLQRIAKGKGGGNYSKSDVDVLKAEKLSSDGRINGEDAEGDNSDCDDGEKSPSVAANVSASFVADLQKQLLLAHEQLVKKDQELVIERAKSACMAANLLDRIAELDKEAERAKRRTSMSNNKATSPSNIVSGVPLAPSSAERSVHGGSTHSRQVDRSDDASVRSTRSFQVDDSDKRRKPRKSMASRIPFRFSGRKESNGSGDGQE